MACRSRLSKRPTAARAASVAGAGARAARLGLLGLLAGCPSVLDLDAYEDAAPPTEAAAPAYPPDSALAEAGWVGQAPSGPLSEAATPAQFWEAGAAPTFAPAGPDAQPEPPAVGPCAQALPTDGGASASADTAPAIPAGRGWQITIPDAALAGDAADAACETAQRARPE